MNKKTMRFIALGLIVLSLAVLAAGCSGSGGKSANSSGGSMARADAAAAPAPYPMEAASGGSSWNGYDDYGYSDYDYAYEEVYYDEKSSAPGSVMQGQESAAALNADKIIYSGSANVETIRFDETVEQVYALIEEYGGFLESSYIGGRDYYTTYYNRPSYRSASFTIRVPKDRFQSFTGALETLGNLTNSSVQAQNITSSYYDTQSRLNTYRTEEERLLDMLSKADTVEDMLNIEDRLASVRYNIESLTSTLTNWDSQVNYSTVNLSISEVKELTQETPITRTFGEELSQRFRDSWEGLVRGVKSFVLFLLGASPILIPVLAVIVVIILIIRSKIRKKREKKAVEVDR